MITKGIIIEINGSRVKVRIPILDGIKGSKTGVEDRDLLEATICTLPHINNTLKVNDIVFVGFEDNDLGKPIILGHLYQQSNWQTDPKTISQGISDTDLNLRCLNTSSITVLNKETSIGEVKPSEIACLEKCQSNIQEQINNLVLTFQSKIRELEDRLNNI